MPRPFVQRPLSQEDRAAWTAFASRIAPLPGRAGPAETPPAEAPRAAPPAGPSPAPCPAPDPRSPPAGLDRATWRRLRTGRIGVEATLDLHGRTAHEAHRRLRDFVLSAHAARRRCVEVITGRGRGEGGVLRRELPFWLDDPALRPLVVAALHPPANPGCVRLLLRRHRP